jgi:2-amino-4-hydroxy-6-hydroxymethyldihydropteridine diphosphokinase
MALATVGLGSNLGASSEALVMAVAAIGKLGTVIRESSVYRTAPQGGHDQRDFLNQVVLIETEIPAKEFLAKLHQIENAAGRTRSVRWEARTLDLDLIMYDQMISDHPSLQLPHPRAVHRRFVLEPLIEVDASATFPDGTRAADALLEVMNQPVDRIRTEQPTKLGVG